MRPDAESAALAALENRPGFRVQRVLADRVNFLVEENGRPAVYGKIYAKPTLWARIAGRTGRFPGTGEAELLDRLDAAGVPVPRVVASGILPGGRSFVATRAVRGAEPLDDALRRGALALGRSGPRRETIESLAHVVRRIHDAGIVHRDLYLCHVLLSDGGGLAVIDWGRGLFRRRRRWRVKDLAALRSSAPEGAVSTREAIRFLRAYLGPGVSLRPWARRVERKAARYRSHEPRTRAAASAAAAGAP